MILIIVKYHYVSIMTNSNFNKKRMTNLFRMITCANTKFRMHYATYILKSMITKLAYTRANRTLKLED
jgi:hypothetical protein